MGVPVTSFTSSKLTAVDGFVDAQPILLLFDSDLFCVWMLRRAFLREARSDGNMKI